MTLASLGTARSAYAFVLHNPLQCLRILWLPLALMFLIAWLLGPRIAALAHLCIHTQPVIAISGASLLPLVLWLLLLFAALTVLGCIMCSGLWRLVLRGVRVHRPFYLAFGKDELRLMALAGLKLAVLLGWGLITVLLAGLLEAVIVHFSGSFSFLALVLASLVSVGALVLLGARLSLSGPATIDARHLAFAASWKATEHNVTRLQRVAVLLVVPIAVVTIVLLLLLLVAFVHGSQLVPPPGLASLDLARICAPILARLAYLLPVALSALYLILLFTAALLIVARALEYQALGAPAGGTAS